MTSTQERGGGPKYALETISKFPSNLCWERPIPASTMAKTNLFTASLLPLLLIACAGSAEQTEGDATAKPPARSTTDGSDPKAPPVPGKPQTGDLVESLGVFVTSAGSATPDGTRARPFPSIQQGIDAAKKVGKRVYVCAGSYSEALVLADSISVIGGLDCSKPEWTVGGPDARTKIVAPTSPAITARAITTPTKIAGLDVVAPNATDPGASSIGLFADKSPALIVASSSITAGDGAKGRDGAEGILLVQTGTIDGIPSEPGVECTAATCKQYTENNQPKYYKPNDNAGATSICAGAPGHDGEPGGAGGSGGLSELYLGPDGEPLMAPYKGNSFYLPAFGEVRYSTPGAAGLNGGNADPVGTLGADGYAPANGTPGTDGSPGKGGSGGAGLQFEGWQPYREGTIFRGTSGAGGGAGGCPGLAGGAGEGGGASIAIALVESPILIENAKVVSATGGAPGLGAFGSKPGRGGAPGYGPYPAQASRNGGNGGVAGTSGNGAAGPSFGIAHVGAAPRTTSSVVTPGSGGASVPARTKADNGVGALTSIAATPDGLSEAIHAF